MKANEIQEKYPFGIQYTIPDSLNASISKENTNKRCQIILEKLFKNIEGIDEDIEVKK